MATTPSRPPAEPVRCRARRMAAVAVSIACAAAAPGWARANCAAPLTYQAKVTASTVVVSSLDFGKRPCPDPGGMLRQDVQTRQIVRLADLCTLAENWEAPAGTSPAYVDECVPAGTYRYGYAQPYACTPSSCSTDSFTQATVTTILPADCTRTAGFSAPVPADTAPWADQVAVCSSASPPPGSGGCSSVRQAATEVLLADAAVIAAALIATRVRRRRRRSP